VGGGRAPNAARKRARRAVGWGGGGRGGGRPIPLEEAWVGLRREAIRRAAALAGDARPEARAVLRDNIDVIDKLSGAVDAATRARRRVQRLAKLSALKSGF